MIFWLWMLNERKAQRQAQAKKVERAGRKSERGLIRVVP